MAKTTKKKNRKLKRQIRKTVGALLMISAITVAAVPVTEAEAVDPAEKVKVLNYTDDSMNTFETINGDSKPLWQSQVPYVKEGTTIYTDETGTFQFAFMTASNESINDVAVIMGITPSNIQNGNLTIPDYVDAYKKYVANSTGTGYCAVNRRDKYLYYEITVHAQNSDEAYLFDRIEVNELDENGMRTGKTTNIADRITSKSPGMVQKESGWYYSQLERYQVTEYDQEAGKDVTKTVSETLEYYAEPKMTTGYAPCYRENISEWEDKQLFYWEKAGVAQDNPLETDGFKAVSAGDNQNQRIHDAEVQYIGRQRVVGSNGEWSVGPVAKPGSEDKGVFYNIGQIVNLTIGDKLIGIGDYAFYRCTGIQSVTLGGNLNTIGNGAFAECNAMHMFGMQLHSQISVIGKQAFLNCEALTQIDIPVSVDAIGDECFKGCTGLRNIYMCAESEQSGIVSNPNLTTVGIDAFVDCSSLASLTFPSKCAEKLPITYMSGCTALQYIKSNNKAFDVVDESDAVDGGKDHTACAITNFLKGLTYSDSFYFEGEDDWAIHETAKVHSAAFKYANSSPTRFEKVIWCPETAAADAPHGATWIIEVNDSGASSLVDMNLDPNCKEVEIPGSIGGYGVEKISAGSFRDNCFLTKITIPNTVQNIESGAFQGCHNLKYVMFSQPNNPGLEIGQGAFNTQQVGRSHMTGCDGKLDSEPFLSFTGDISDENGNLSKPFMYAMDAANNIDAAGQNQQMNSYITFYSGWPTNLVVKYNPEKDKNELIDYPRYEDLANYQVFDLEKADRNSLPYVTADYARAAMEAKGKVDSYKENPVGERPTQDQFDIVNAALNLNLPVGIESIAEGIFSGVDSENKPAKEYVWEQQPDGEWKKVEKDLSANKSIESITMNTVEEIEPYTFAKCESLSGFYMNGGQAVDDYAFKDCEKLSNVEISASVSELGLRPFAGCSTLTDVNFMGSPNFVCEDAIIYGLKNGTKDSIVECLETRGVTKGSAQIGPDELAGITTIEPEAFKGTGVGTIDLSSTSVSNIPEQCFAQTNRLSTVTLPDAAKSIGKGAFWNTNVFSVKIPASVSLIQPEAFANVEVDSEGEIKYDDRGEPTILNAKTGHSQITIVCTENSPAETYAENYYYMNPSRYEPEIYFNIRFWDAYQGIANAVPLGEAQSVLKGSDAVPPTPPVHDGVTFTGWQARYGYTEVQASDDVYAMYSTGSHKVEFRDYDGTLLSSQQVEHKQSAVPPEDPAHEGATFKGWSPDYHDITEDTICVAQFDWGVEGNIRVVTFYSYDGNLIAEMKVLNGGTVYPPPAPEREGYTFVGWVPANGFSNITSDKTFTASYDRAVVSPSPSGVPSPSGGDPGANPSGSGARPSGSGSNSSGSGGSSPTPTPTVTPTSEAVKYTVSVSGGSGSGSYPAGAIVAINAYYMGDGQVFDRWTSSTAGVGFVNPSASSTTFTMPAANVAITATYKTGSSSSVTPVSSSGGGTNTVNTVSNNNGTIVDVTRPGISNTNLAGATVSGATDNFIVKVTEDQAATDAATAALQARYGDLSRIKYLPMDISLYDSTGRTKIADTSGISVNLTLPLPDDLIQYAGNNRVAAISGGELEDLNVRFTTVGGVPCVNFTATHFSPYVIYVDTANLSDAVIDATPKTGDPIHPKWFLAIGLACISLILFFKRDKVIINTKTA